MQGPIKYKVLVKRINYSNKNFKFESAWEEIITARTKEDLMKKVSLYFNTKRLLKKRK